MREILFRGKSLDFGDWLCGYIRQYEDGKITICDFEANRLWFVDPSTVGQYTGLTDNGTKIFEGDIVTGLFAFGMEVKAVVVFQDGAFGLQWIRGGAEQFSAFTSICNVEYEAIGNIHDNPELLEEG